MPHFVKNSGNDDSTALTSARKKRALSMHKTLKKLYPETHIELRYDTPFQLLVAVILSAQCTDKRVNQITPKLFKKYPTIKTFAQTQQSTLEKYIYSTGFYRNKAKNIIAAAKKVQNDFNGELPQDMKTLLTIPGVARKTANVIQGALFNIHEGVTVDTHVRRFALKFNLTNHTTPVHIEKDLMKILPKTEWWSFPHRLISYGRDYCPALKHDCTKHPLTKIYPQAAQNWPKTR